MLITKKEFSLKILNILDLFFKDSRAYDFTLFMWPKKQENNIIKIDIQFTYKISENNSIISGSSAFLLFEKINFITPYLKFQNNFSLSSYLAKELDSFYMNTKEYDNNFALVTGFCLFYNQWKEDVQGLLGTDNIKLYYANQRLETLTKILPQKINKIKFIKI